MSAIDDFSALLETTPAIRQLLKSLKEEPANLLGELCQEYERTGQPVPDHYLHFVGFLGEVALKALLSLGLIARRPGGRTSVFSYEPTATGIEYYHKLKADGFYTEKK